MFYLSLSERDIFSVESGHVSEKEEQHCFCKQWNISGIPRGSESGGHPAASDAEHTLKKQVHGGNTGYILNNTLIGLMND